MKFVLFIALYHNIHFSLYMWHFPLLLLYISLISQQFQNWSNGFKIVSVFAWTLLIIFPVSVLLSCLVEMPGMRLGERFLQRI
jgi:peptidoglycan/LPS O-acetylase OafA/YrhL